MSTTTPTPEPDDIARGLAELERLANQAPATPTTDIVVSGETKRVKQLRAEVAEARLLGALQDDPAPLFIDTLKVRKRRKQAGEAARLHQLAQDPTMRAWQASRMRRLLVVGAMVSLALALAWSTAGVQAFAADGAEKWSAGWVFAWLVEPFMSLALLVVVGARAYLGTRGQPIESRTLVRIEWLFLALTLGMNAWPYLPWALPAGAEFSVSRLVLHILGPIVAVAIVTALPIILAAFADLDHGRTGRATGGSAPIPASVPVVSGEAPSNASELEWDMRDGRAPVTPPRGRSLDDHRTELTILIAQGALPAKPSAETIRKTLGCGRTAAATLRRELVKGGAV